ncbi:hypothetical protein EXIGLDRAFT_413211 [Exidia glandulosa HHB12029]|uniref:Uncharacterized protein n=1 Tax=Exidia glandulosa HHB12029 TaxID=1314781 RepID=A0A165BEX2_EXIGL|nr:hypothetical protein EXIGLDRAFT_413211 [Exidia glandulosa HHB12029]
MLRFGCWDIRDCAAFSALRAISETLQIRSGCVGRCVPQVSCPSASSSSRSYPRARRLRSSNYSRSRRPVHALLPSCEPLRPLASSSAKYSLW